MEVSVKAGIQQVSVKEYLFREVSVKEVVH